jgi:acetylornithine/succinyldiaminopimelate/putrescine aminotransferase
VDLSNNIVSDFEYHLAQSTRFKQMQIEVEKGEGIYLFDKNGKKYIDLMSGISVNNLGHRNPKIMEALKTQMDKHLHAMVYGELVQEEQVKLVKNLAEITPGKLDTTFLVNSGSEAIDGAIKLSRLYTNRTEIVSFKGSYHGSTLGAMALSGHEVFKRPFRPLMPDVRILEYNCFEDLDRITEKTAAVFVEPIQTASGMVMPEDGFLQAIRKKCDETGSLLVFDEIQTAFGRTGKMFASEYFNVVPDVLCLGKALGGGMPIGVFISTREIMNSLENGHPLLGHATTFGGHPLICAAANANTEVLKSEKYISEVQEKSKLFEDLLQHNLIKNIHGTGLLLGVELSDKAITKKFITKIIDEGIITYWFLFNENTFSINPPLIISEGEIRFACKKIIEVLDSL